MLDRMLMSNTAMGDDEAGLYGGAVMSQPYVAYLELELTHGVILAPTVACSRDHAPMLHDPFLHARLARCFEYALLPYSDPLRRYI